jgi:TPR repeat protein
LVEANKWFQFASVPGDAIAQAYLGLMYHLGQGIARDDTQALKWTRLAAAQGFALGQFNLANAYLQGEGVKPDPVRAHLWFVLAAAGGEARAKLPLAQLEKTLAPPQLDESQALSKHCQETKLRDCV